MTLGTGEFIRRFLMHILPDKFHRIRHYGFLANAVRLEKLAAARRALSVSAPESTVDEEKESQTFICRQCGTPLHVIDIIRNPYQRVRAPPITSQMPA